MNRWSIVIGSFLALGTLPLESPAQEVKGDLQPYDMRNCLIVSNNGKFLRNSGIIAYFGTRKTDKEDAIVILYSEKDDFVDVRFSIRTDGVSLTRNGVLEGHIRGKEPLVFKFRCGNSHLVQPESTLTAIFWRLSLEPKQHKEQGKGEVNSDSVSQFFAALLYWAFSIFSRYESDLFNG